MAEVADVGDVATRTTSSSVVAGDASGWDRGVVAGVVGEDGDADSGGDVGEVGVVPRRLGANADAWGLCGYGVDYDRPTQYW